MVVTYHFFRLCGEALERGSKVIGRRLLFIRVEGMSSIRISGWLLLS
jgi:hypothetical protein